MVVQIQSEDEAPHLVSLAQGTHRHPLQSVGGLTFVFSVATAEEKPGASWHLFNDFLVKPVSEEEVLSFPGKWKVRAWLLETHALRFLTLTALADPGRSLL